MRRLVGSILALPFLLVAACNSEGRDEDGEAAAEPIAEDELPERAAQSTCELIYECSCENPDSPDEPTCVEAERLELSESQTAAQAYGLTYDAQCAGELLAKVEAAGCAPTSEFECETFCAAYHGDLRLGDACVVPVPLEWTWSECEQGLWCFEGTCQNPCPELPSMLGVGEVCRDESGPIGQCDDAAGLWCDYASEVCIALPDIGEPCYQSEICGPGATCEFSGNEALCVALPNAGQPCSSVCVDGYYCTGVDGAAGTCEALPGEGESCAATYECAKGYGCNFELTCVALPAWICQ